MTVYYLLHLLIGGIHGVLSSQVDQSRTATVQPLLFGNWCFGRDPGLTLRDRASWQLCTHGQRGLLLSQDTEFGIRISTQSVSRQSPVTAAASRDHHATGGNRQRIRAWHD